MDAQALKQIEDKLVWNSRIVAFGLAFIVAFAMSMMLVMLWQAYRVGHGAARLESVASETHDALCALYSQNVEQNRAAIKRLSEVNLGSDPVTPEVRALAASLIQSGIDQRTKTIDAMKGAGLTC